MNRPNLLIHVEGVQLVDMNIALAIWVAIIAVQCDLLDSRLLFFRDNIRTAIGAIVFLAHSLQVVGNVDRREIGRGISSLSLGLLFLPTRIEKFNCDTKLASQILKGGKAIATDFSYAPPAHQLESAACNSDTVPFAPCLPLSGRHEERSSL